MQINARIGQLDTSWLYAAHKQLKASNAKANRPRATADERVEQSQIHADDVFLSQIDAELRVIEARKRVSAANDALVQQNAYELENLRLATLMRDRSFRKRSKKKKNFPRIVEDMLTLEKRYAEAAYRGHLHRRVLHTWKQWEFWNAAKCQSVMRMFLAKKRVQQRQRHLACLRIQSLWRGFHCRKSSDLLWLSSKVVNLQRLVRGRLARKAFRAYAQLCHESAAHIQRLYRGMKARMRVELMLRDRETQNRQDLMAILENEEEWHRQHRDKFVARLERFRLKQKVIELEDKYRSLREEIADMESIFLDMQEQRLRVSPRAIEQGWVEEMEAKMKLQRAKITEAKLHVMFSVALELRTREEEFVHLQTVIERIELKRKRWEMWRQEEFLVYWERECRFHHERKELERAQRVADTRRHWSINFFTKEGKPDKRRQGNTWDPSVLEAAKAKEVYCVGNADLLAFMESHLQPTQTEKASSGGHKSKEDANLENFNKTVQRVEQMERKVELVTSTLEMKQTEAIFDPVFKDVEARVHRIQHHATFQPAHPRPKLLPEHVDSKGQGPAGSKDTGKVESASDDRQSALVASHAQKKRAALKSAKIPWHLLDQLAAERKKLDAEKAMFRIWRRGQRKGSQGT